MSDSDGNCSFAWGTSCSAGRAVVTLAIASIIFLLLFVAALILIFRRARTLLRMFLDNFRMPDKVNHDPQDDEKHSLHVGWMRSRASLENAIPSNREETYELADNPFDELHDKKLSSGGRQSPKIEKQTDEKLSKVKSPAESKPSFLSMDKMHDEKTVKDKSTSDNEQSSVVRQQKVEDEKTVKDKSTSDNEQSSVVRQQKVEDEKTVKDKGTSDNKQSSVVRQKKVEDEKLVKEDTQPDSKKS